MTVRRCQWAEGDPLYSAYHDEEWGVPLHDDQRLFEFLILDGAQAGLSWITILRKRENYRRAFDDFDPHKIAGYGEHKIAQLLADPGIVRNRLKIRSAIQNARAFLQIQKDPGDFDRYIWDFVAGETMQNTWRSLGAIPTETTESRALSRDLKKRGFSFVGPTIVYAFMQGAGLVNDHLVDCFRHEPLS